MITVAQLTPNADRLRLILDDEVRRLGAVIDSGGVRSGQTLTVDQGGRCEAPILLIEKPKTRRQRVWVERDVRCRSCRTCLRNRAREWRFRIKSELASAERTWFGTMTLSPDNHQFFLSLARSRLQKRGTDLETLSDQEAFQIRHWAICPEITRFVKRVRKKSNAKLRYILVAEPHKSGLPHYHMLIHESDPSNPVRHSQLQSNWVLGFSSWKLVEDGSRASYYVAKYLAKSSAARVRASLRYGVAVDNNHDLLIIDGKGRDPHRALVTN